MLIHTAISPSGYCHSHRLLPPGRCTLFSVFSLLLTVYLLFLIRILIPHLYIRDYYYLPKIESSVFFRTMSVAGTKPAITVTTKSIPTLKPAPA